MTVDCIYLDEAKYFKCRPIGCFPTNLWVAEFVIDKFYDKLFLENLGEE